MVTRYLYYTLERRGCDFENTKTLDLDAVKRCAKMTRCVPLTGSLIISLREEKVDVLVFSSRHSVAASQPAT